ncbi:hypothetical protein [Sulfurovum sp. bin170]|uniref:hypothetical protein n=1 Tax=Sulfurovum sp. bin170 TaxID=2695268 RepID=UPI0013DF28F1|nr:hypothetical protein [Sulfurovum sp. bin170]
MKQIKKRIIWGFSPVTRVVRSKKTYNRKRDKHGIRKELVNRRMAREFVREYL